MAAEARIRALRPSDFTPVIAVIDEWWGGRPMARMLPRLFFDHFTDTSFAADRDEALAGFLVGFVSPAQPGEAYIHFVGVHPGERIQGLGRRLYGTFFDAVRARGCTRVRAVTSPVNTGSVAFHRRMELRVALQEWLARYPDFELADPSAVTWSGGQVRGPRTLPLTILRP